MAMMIMIMMLFMCNPEEQKMMTREEKEMNMNFVHLLIALFFQRNQSMEKNIFSRKRSEHEKRVCDVDDDYDDDEVQ